MKSRNNSLKDNLSLLPSIHEYNQSHPTTTMRATSTSLASASKWRVFTAWVRESRGGGTEILGFITHSTVDTKRRLRKRNRLAKTKPKGERNRSGWKWNRNETVPYSGCIPHADRNETVHKVRRQNLARRGVSAYKTYDWDVLSVF